MSKAITEAMIRDAFNQHKKTSLKALASYYDFAAGYEAALSVQIEGGDKGDAGRKLSLWFFRDLSGEQRGKLFGLFGLTDAQKDTNHGYQAMALAHVVRLLAPSASIEGETP